MVCITSSIALLLQKKLLTYTMDITGMNLRSGVETVNTRYKSLIFFERISFK